MRLAFAFWARAMLWLVGSGLLAWAAPADSLTLGGLQLALPLPAGWERAPEEAEKENKTWMFGYELPKDQGTVIVAVSFDHLPFSSAKDRQARVEKFIAGFRRQPGFNQSEVLLAGQKTTTLRCAAQEDGAFTTNHYFLVPGPTAAYPIYVFVPGREAPVPAPAWALLNRLTLAGTPLISQASPGPAAPVLPAPKAPAPTTPPLGTILATPATPGLPDTPWVSVPTSAPTTPPVATPPVVAAPAVIADFLDFNTLTQEQYTGAVSATVEALRQFQGPLSPAETAAFEAKWAPYFDHPGEAIVAYLNQLNPLLAQSLAIRAALASALMDFDQARHNATMAAFFRHEPGTRTALAVGYRHRQMILSLQATLTSITEQIVALGNPPDPLAAREFSRRRHQAAVRQVRELSGECPLDGEWEYSDGRRVVHQQVMTTDDGLVLVYSYNRTFFDKLYEEGEGDLSQPGTARTKRGEMIVIPGLSDLLAVYAVQTDGSLLSFSSDLVTYLQHLTVAGNDLTWRGYSPADGIFNQAPKFTQGTAHCLGDAPATPPVPRGQSWEAVLALVRQSGEAKVQTMRDLLAKRPAEVAALLRGHESEGQVAARQAARRTARLAEIAAWEAEQRQFDVAQRLRLILSADTSMDAPKTAAERDARVKTLLPQAQAEHLAEMQKQKQQMLAELERELQAMAAAPAPEKPTPPPAPAGPSAAELAARQQAEQEAAKKVLIEEREANIRYLEDRLALARPAALAAKDEATREFYAWQIRGWEADIQGERDQIHRLQTGEFRHTRTAWDEQALQAMVQKSVAYNQRCDTTRRLAAGAERLADTVPPEEADALRAFIRRQFDATTLANGDVERARRAVKAVYERVQGSLAADAAAADERAAVANLGLTAAENIQTAADLAMTVISPFSSQGVMYAYQAAAGYVAGGPVEAIKKVTGTYSQAADYVITAYDGYQVGGWEQAGGDVAIKYLQNKVMDLAVARLTAGPKAPPPTVKEQFEAARFQHEAEWGTAMVKDFELRQARLEAAGRRPETTPADLLRLQKEVQESVAAITGAPPAKNCLKYRGNPHAQRAFDAHQRAIYAEVDAKFMERMKADGYRTDEWQLKEFRNLDSLGSVNMDRDVGLDESTLTRLLKHGQRASLHQWQTDAQAAYRRAYKQVTGRSADAAWQTVTTSIHPEAYRDTAWLGKNLGNLNPAWAPQAADVTRFKASHVLHDPANRGLSHYGKLQEMSRGSAKDMNTKLLPLLRGTRPKTPEAQARLAESLRHWQQMQTVLEAFGNGKLDPLTAQRRIYEVSGGLSLTQIVDEMATLMAATAKLGPR